MTSPSQGPTGRLPYHAPALRSHGTVQDMTQASLSGLPLNEGHYGDPEPPTS